MRPVFVQSLPSVQIAELVSTSQFDVGIVEMPVSRPAIDIEELGASTAVVVLPVTHILAAQDCISIRDLDGERMIMLSQHSLARYHIDDAFSLAGVAPVVAMETPSSTIACALVVAGVGITIVSQSTAGSFISPGIAARPLVPSISFRFSVVFPEAVDAKVEASQTPLASIWVWNSGRRSAGRRTIDRIIGGRCRASRRRPMFLVRGRESPAKSIGLSKSLSAVRFRP